MKIEKNKLLLFIQKSIPSCLEVISYSLNTFNEIGDDGKKNLSGELIIANCLFEIQENHFPSNNLYPRTHKKITVSKRNFLQWMKETQFIKQK